MKQFQNFEDGIKINIFKYVDHPLNLILTCQIWSAISKNPYAKTEWLIVHYGKAHALFHAVRLGLTFIDMSVCQTLIAKNVVVSRYLIQRLFENFGTYNQKLIEFKIEHSFGQCDTAKIYDFRKEIKSPWANHLMFIMFVLIYLLNEEYGQLANANEGLPLKGNNMKLSRFLSAHKMLKDIKILISNKIIAPRQKSLRLVLNSDLHIHQLIRFEDNHENNKFGIVKFFKQTRFLRYYYKSDKTMIFIFIYFFSLTSMQIFNRTNFP